MTKEETKVKPFDILFSLAKQKLYTEEEVKQSGLNIYLLLTYIRSSPVLLPVAQYLNENYKMKFYDMYLFVFFTFKRFNIQNVRWVKGDKLAKPQDVEMIQKYYYVKYKVAENYLTRMSKEDLDYIKEFYRTGGSKDV